MKYLILGATGFIGSNLVWHLLKKGHNVAIIARNLGKARKLFGDKVIAFESLEKLPDTFNADVVMNLGGENIASEPWFEKRKQALLSSRLDAIAQLKDWLKKTGHKPIIFQASAIGWYGNLSGVLDESSNYKPSFSHNLCEAVEKSAKALENHAQKLFIMRLGVVFGPNGGYLKNLRKLFSLGLGFILGDGKQILSWIHIEDIIGALEYLLIHDCEAGIYNFTSPSPITQEEFAKAYAKSLQRPLFLKLPSKIVKKIFGKMGEELLLGSCHVVPKKLQEVEFPFRYNTVQEAFHLTH